MVTKTSLRLNRTSDVLVQTPRGMAALGRSCRDTDASALFDVPLLYVQTPRGMPELVRMYQGTNASIWTRWYRCL